VEDGVLPVLPGAADEDSDEGRSTLLSEPHPEPLDESSQHALGEDDAAPADAFGWRQE
jgi:hypothetical protein